MFALSSRLGLLPTLLALILLLALGGGCDRRTSVHGAVDLGVDLRLADVRVPDLGPSCDTSADWDSDGIKNGDEGCLEQRDTDKDGTPDFQDFDSDGDGVIDRIEAGIKGKCVGPAKHRWPCDSDGDGTPDYLDVDSDGDGLLDKDEDLNGDGLLGCCLRECGKPEGDQGEWPHVCILNTEGCSGDQRCVAGACSPLVDFSCADGETDRIRKDTFGKGKLDSTLGFFVCRDGEAYGRKWVQKRTSTNPMGDRTSGDWRLALRKSATYTPLILDVAKDKEAAAAIDYRSADEQVAGFVLSMPATKADLSAELAAVIAKLQADPPAGPAGATVSVISPGTRGKSHDLYDIVRGTRLHLAGVNGDTGTLRNELIANILGRVPATLGKLPPPLGDKHQDLVLRFATIRRFAFEQNARGELVLDSDGFPLEDTSRAYERRVLVIGAIAAKKNYEDPSMKSGLIVDDLSGGTAVAEWIHLVRDECDAHVLGELPVADILWVVDGSDSMDRHRHGLLRGATALFSRALASGLDFRMGVTNVCRPNAGASCVQGKFCSRASSDLGDSGGVDRFLLPTELQTFRACIKNPPGKETNEERGLENAREAVSRHLPRASGAPDKLRPGAVTVVIIASNEVPSELSTIVGSERNTCVLPGAKQALLDSAVAPYVDLFRGTQDPETTATVHVIGGGCANSCFASVAHGYRELAQKLKGQVFDICQEDLGAPLETIVDDLVAAAAPIELDYRPIAASMAVTLDGAIVPRSRVAGFDYRPESNRLVFVDTKYKKGSEVAVGYSCWQLPGSTPF